MRKNKFIQGTVAVLLMAACVMSQSGTSWADPTGSAHWESDGGIWKYYDKSGSLALGWIQTNTGWYYMNPVDGTMLTRWQDIDGKRYYLNTALDGTEGNMRTGWFQTADGNKFFLSTAQDGTFGATLSGWQMIDGYCYYFEPAEGADAGKMYTKKNTPDGFQTDEQGRWVESNGFVYHEPGKGLSSTANTTAKKSLESKRSARRGSSGSGNSGSRKTTKPLLNEAKTKLLDLGWIRYVVITFENGSVADYSVQADGTDITDVLTPVDDNKKIVKWETTVLKPGSITVTRKSDNRKQTVKITGSAPAEVLQAGSINTVPTAILTNGPVSRFDYYLDVYDKNSQVRTTPGRTTFDLSGYRNPAADEIPSSYYSPDTLINQENGNGEIIVKLSLKTKAQEAWFDKITTLKALDKENQILHSNLAFRKSIEEQYGKAGILKINLPQTNLFSRGRYLLNLISDYSSATMTLPIHLVDNRTFMMKLNTLNLNPKPGESFAFTITDDSGATFGNEILSPIYRVDLTMPSGETKTLEKFKEWYEIGDLLHIGRADTKEKTVTVESGLYTITVYANGYQTMKKSVEIGSGIQSFSSRPQSAKKSSGVDIITSASIKSSPGNSGGSGSSGGGAMNAFLIFNHDLITNALILEELGMTNQAANAVLKRWKSQKPVSVMNDNAVQLYDFVTYLNAVKDTGMNRGEYLSFSRYAEMGDGQTKNRPYQVKRVLEDGLLGSSFQFSEMEGKRTPQLNVAIAALGEDVILSSNADPLYLNAGIKLYLNGSATALRSDEYLEEYLFNQTAGTLTIYSTRKGTAGGSLQLPAGEHELKIFSEGYQPAKVMFKVNKTLEQFDLTLVNPNPALKENAENASVYYKGQDVHIKAATDETNEEPNSLRGDFMKNLETIELRSPEGITSKVTSNTEGSLSGNDNYVPEKFSLILQKGLFKESGMYLITARATGYTPKTLEFHIETIKEAEIPSEPLEAPKFKKSVYMPSPPNSYYQVSFNAVTQDEQDALKTYLKTIDDQDKVTIQVNGKAYERTGFSFWNDTNKYKISRDPSFGDLKYLELTADGLKEEENTITIEADGYQKLSFHVKIHELEKVVTPVKGKTLEQFDLALVDPNPSAKKDAENASAYYTGQSVHIKTASDESDKEQSSLRGDFMKNLEEIELRNPKGVTSKVASNTEGSLTGDNNYVPDKFSLILQKGLFSEHGAYLITARATGYTPKTLEFNIETEKKTETPSVASETPNVLKIVHMPSSSDSYYQVSFKSVTQNEQDALKAYLKIIDNRDKTTVQVNGTSYERTGFSFWNDTNKYKISRDRTFGGMKYLELTADGFKEGENTITIDADGYQKLSFRVTIDGLKKVVTSNKGKVTSQTQNLLTKVPSEDENVPETEEKDELVPEASSVEADTPSGNEADDRAAANSESSVDAVSSATTSS